jgi:hypothetical protein
MSTLSVTPLLIGGSVRYSIPSGSLAARHVAGPQRQPLSGKDVTMKVANRALLGVFVIGAVVLFARAEDDKKPDAKSVTLKGTIVCSKCELGETPACGQAIKVKADDKEVIYYFVDKAGKEPYHGTVCKSPTVGSVTGVVSEKDKKKFITPDKDGVKFDK